MTFRSFGPLLRFDHHRGDGATMRAAIDPDRAVYYAAWSENASEAFASCLVEVFGDTGMVEPSDFHVAMPEVTADLTLLDLLDSGSMRAGTVAAIAKCPHDASQPWSRFFYERVDLYDTVDGLIYRNAHNDQPALVLYERAQARLHCTDDDTLRLDDGRIRIALLTAMRANNLVF